MMTMMLTMKKVKPPAWVSSKYQEGGEEKGRKRKRKRMGKKRDEHKVKEGGRGERKRIRQDERETPDRNELD